MTQYVAFLRAINVGGHTVRMDALRRHFETWGGQNVETFIASGNVIFHTARRDQNAAERAIEAHIEKALGYPVMTYLRSIPELAAVAAHAPFAPDEYERGGRLFVGFMKSAATPSMAHALAALRTDIDDLAVAGRGGLLAATRSVDGVARDWTSDRESHRLADHDAQRQYRASVGEEIL